MSRQRGWTLIELLAAIFVVGAITTGVSVAREYGAWAAFGGGALAAWLSAGTVISIYRWSWRREKLRLQVLRQKFRAIYRVVAVPTGPKIIAMPDGAEIRHGDYGWEAGPIRQDGLIYLHGLTPEWTVVWHAVAQLAEPGTLNACVVRVRVPPHALDFTLAPNTIAAMEWNHADISNRRESLALL